MTLTSERSSEAGRVRNKTGCPRFYLRAGLAWSLRAGGMLGGRSGWARAVGAATEAR